ncbi:MAG: ATP-binding cassette domain-containing protein [Bacillus sp. (in: firmicutes)]
MKEYAVQASHVSKRFDQEDVLHDLHFTINHNTKLAIVGHNGSGKSTLLKLIANIYRPSSGKIDTFGKVIRYVPEHFSEKIRFKLGEYLLHIGMMSGEKKDVVQRKVNDYCEMFDLHNHMNTFLKNCSKGTQQKAGLIQALITDCDILLIDEPLTGLDDDSKKNFIQLIQDKERDFTFIFTSHEQETVNALADEILVLENGRIVKQEIVMDATMKSITAKVTKSLHKEELKVYGSIIHEKGNKVELVVPERESDQCLLYLLENDCSIIEVKEMK